jgi:hypothetical protein
MYVFQIIIGDDIPPIIEQCLHSVKLSYPSVDVIKFEKNDDPITLSDNIRSEILSKNDDCLFIDWDIVLHDTLKINPGYINTNYYKNQPDYSLIYCPEKTMWNSIIKERDGRGINSNTYGWIRKVLSNKKVMELKAGYKHLRYSLIKKGALIAPVRRKILLKF